jgi:SAM-dependent methyltransferase
MFFTQSAMPDFLQRLFPRRPVPARPSLRAAALWAAFCLLPAGPGLAQDEVPFITTPDRVTQAMLELAGVTSKDFVIDLGSGDGRIVISAARRFGASGLGVDLAQDLVTLSRAHAKAAGVDARVEFRVQDLFDTDLARASVITMYLLPEVNLQLRPRLLALVPGTRIVSHDWDMGDWRPDRSLTLEVPDKTIGLDKRSTVHLWVVPLQVQGTWCTAGGRIDVVQRFQAASVALSADGGTAPLVVFDGRVGADGLHAGSDPRGASVTLQRDGDGLRLTRASGPAARFEGQRFRRGGVAGCG